MLYPLIFATLCGFYDSIGYLGRPDTLFPFPDKPTLDNYRKIIFFTTDPTMFRYLLNSITRTVWLTGTRVLVAFVAGYIFARIEFRGKGPIFWSLLIGRLIPGTVLIVPLYIQMARWPFAGGNNLWGVGGKGLLDTYAPLFLLGIVDIIAIFLVRQTILAGPLELEEAAKIDGAGVSRLIFSVVAPIQKPVLAYLAIINGIGVWNDWFTPFFFTSSQKYQVWASYIARIVQKADRAYAIQNFPLVLAMGIILTIPSVIIFFMFQRYIVEGLARVGIKG